MTVPIELSFRGFEAPASADDLVRAQVADLERFSDRIQACHVAVEAPHQHHERGNLYHVRLEVIVPGADIVVSRDPPGKQSHEHLQVAIKDAFRTMRRRLQEHVRRARHDVKTHEERPTGRVLRLFPEEGYGFLETVDGREVYFHAHGVLHDGFLRLKVGQEVRFAEEDGDEGPQASTVEAKS